MLFCGKRCIMGFEKVENPDGTGIGEMQVHSRY